MEPTVFLVDEEPYVRQSAARLLRGLGRRVESFSDPIDFLRCVNPSWNGVIVLALEQSPLSSTELFEELRRRKIEVPVVILSDKIDVAGAVGAMKRGVFDVLLKSGPEVAFFEAISSAMRVGVEMQSVREQTSVILSRIRQLTNRERQVLDLVLDGQSSRRIGTHLGIEEKTVENHRSRLMRKIGVQNVVQLTREVVVSGYDPSSE